MKLAQLEYAMAQVCPRCSRPNPAEADFCYYDGTPFSNGKPHGSAIDVGKQPFPMPFVFPSGTQCANFDELASACWKHWDEAQTILAKGYLEAFFEGGLERNDLARAARQASRSADGPRGLDELLGQFPTRALAPARLVVGRHDMDLGRLELGVDRTFELHLRNEGQRLLQGRLVCSDCIWLGFGEGVGSQDKLFAFTHELILPLHVRGKQLRASHKPLLARIEIHANGGEETVTVRAEVPARPFASGVLAGAVTPRQVADKARAKPKDAAPLFEGGAVAKWYAENGWEYPVTVAGATGLAALQQFFEALGLAAPPRIKLSRAVLAFHGRPGESLTETLELTTAEKRAVWAHALSDQPWLQVRKESEGRSASIRVEVPAIPDRPGEILHAIVKVTSNGNQCFNVPVTLAVVGPVKSSSTPALAGVLAVESAAAAQARPPVAAVAAAPSQPSPVEPAPIEAAPWKTIASPITSRAPTPQPSAIIRKEALPPPLARMKATPFHWGQMIHLAPACILAAMLLIPILRDAALKVKPPPPPEPEVVLDDPLDWTPLVHPAFHDTSEELLKGTRGVKGGVAEGRDKDVFIQEPTSRFGLTARLKKGNDPTRDYKLTYEPNGWTNNTVIRLDDEDSIFGESPLRNKATGEPDKGTLWRGDGRWKNRVVPLGEDSEGHPRIGRKSIWAYDEKKIEITQKVEVIRGETRLLDTCLVSYRIENKDQRAHQVGLRFMLDTFIGSTDGVPFTIPTLTTPKLCDTSDEFIGKKQVPDFIQVLEKDDLANPGVVAQLQFKLGRGLESPDRVTLGAWPNPRLQELDRSHDYGQQWTMWEVPVQPMKAIQRVDPNAPADSCVVMYWDQNWVQPGKTREVGFSYGLGNVAGSESGGKLALTAGGEFTIGGEFTVTAYLSRPQRGQTVTLTLPDGFELTEGSTTQDVPQLPRDATRNTSPVTWRVKAPLKKGNYTLKAESSTGVSQTRPVTIAGRGLLD